VSLNDGKNWQPLQLNLPAVSVTDIVVHDSDLVLSTNGRSFWILDDVSRLRQMAVESVATPHLFQPPNTYRIATSADEDDQPYVGGACCVTNVRDLYKGVRIEPHQLGAEPPEGAIVYASFPTSPTEQVTDAHSGGDDSDPECRNDHSRRAAQACLQLIRGGTVRRIAGGSRGGGQRTRRWTRSRWRTGSSNRHFSASDGRVHQSLCFRHRQRRPAHRCCPRLL
jgi:hypothetical protein